MPKVLRYCVVPVCHGERFDLVHKFPMEDDRTTQWLNALEIPDLFDIPYQKLRTSVFVCSRHFRKQDYKHSLSRQLNKTAIPCINLKSLDELDQSPLLYTIVEDKSSSQDETQYHKHDPININSRKRPIINLIDYYTDANSTTENNEEPPSKSQNTEEFDTLYIINDENCEIILNNDDKTNTNMKKTNSSGFENDDDLNISKFEIVTHVSDQKTILTREPANQSVKFEMTSKFLKIQHPKYSNKVILLDYFWLRDHCKCELCFSYETNQRIYNLLDIQFDVKPTQSNITDDILFVKWDDDHESEYKIDFLYQSQFEFDKKNVVEQILWDKKTITNEQYANVDLGRLVTDESAVEKVLRSLVAYGIAFITNVPATQDMTEMTIRRLFPIQKTFFGEMWTFSDTENDNHSDTAYTKEFLEAHTDNTYFNDAAGLQIFHCLEHINGSGGETFLVDGFKVVQDLSKRNTDAYNKLCEVNVPAEYIESGRHHTYSAPVICLNNETKKPEQIRFNLYDRAVFNTLPQSEIRDFYEHYRYFAKLIQNKENRWTFKLNPGTVLLFDNWRILHGREGYTGQRLMCGSYVLRTEFLSKARTLKLIN